MGLRNGDVLVAVDGQALTSVDQAYKLYEDLKTSDTASVQINRRGRSTNIEYRIR
jgi:general secretion pathway protein C